MAHHVWTVACLKSSIDRDESQVSLLAVTERLTLKQSEEEAAALDEECEKKIADGGAVQFPVTMHVVTWWVPSDYSKPESAVESRYRVVAPDGWEFPLVVNHHFDLEKGRGHRVRWVLEAFLFRGLGHYWIILESKRGKRWRVEAKLPIEIRREVVKPRS